jgi:hypothetical protein
MCNSFSYTYSPCGHEKKKKTLNKPGAILRAEFYITAQASHPEPEPVEESKGFWKTTIFSLGERPAPPS